MKWQKSHNFKSNSASLARSIDIKIVEIWMNGDRGAEAIRFQFNAFILYDLLLRFFFSEMIRQKAIWASSFECKRAKHLDEILVVYLCSSCLINEIILFWIYLPCFCCFISLEFQYLHVTTACFKFTIFKFFRFCFFDLFWSFMLKPFNYFSFELKKELVKRLEKWYNRLACGCYSAIVHIQVIFFDCISGFFLRRKIILWTIID